MNRGCVSETASSWLRGASRLRHLAIAGLMASALLAFLLIPAPDSASADSGVVSVSRHGGQPGEEVTVTVGCACFPPCKGPKGHKHPEGSEHGGCSPGPDRRPASFGVSLLPLAKVKAVRGCTHRTCSGTSASLPPDPSARPYSFLGFARPPAGEDSLEKRYGRRYRLSFTIPDLRPGTYSYVVWCTACVGGHRGPLVADPNVALWHLAVRPPRGAARDWLSAVLSMLRWA
jgi:hypothetical protein